MAEEEGCAGAGLVPNRESVAHFETQTQQRRPYTVTHLKTCFQEEWDKVTPEKLPHLLSSVPKRLLSVVKRNGNFTKW